MKSNHLNSVISRLASIKDEYKQPLPTNSIDNLAKICPLHILPEDFVILNTICRCDFFDFFNFWNFENEEGVIGETLFFRKEYGLPNEYLILAQQDDVAFVLLK